MWFAHRALRPPDRWVFPPHTSRDRVAVCRHEVMRPAGKRGNICRFITRKYSIPKKPGGAGTHGRTQTGRKTPGGAGTHTGHTGHTGARGHTDHTRTNLTTIHPNPSGTCTVPVQRHGGSRDTPKTEQYSSSFSTPSTGSVRFRDATWASGVAL